MSEVDWDPLADSKLVLIDALFSSATELTLSALRIRRWGTASTHVGKKHPVSTERVKFVAGHPSLGRRGYTSQPMERRKNELLIVAEWQASCALGDAAALAAAMKSLRKFCGGGSMIPHIATVGTAAATAMAKMCDACGDDAESALRWSASWKDVAPFLQSRGLELGDGGRAPGLELDASHTSAMKGFLALKLLDDMDASGWRVSFADGSISLRALL